MLLFLKQKDKELVINYIPTFLIIRFSSIGDIVLTTPIIRAIKQKYPVSKIIYLTKSSFTSLLEFNPNIDVLIGLKDNLEEIIDRLNTLNIDYIIDLHKNIRSLKVKNQVSNKKYFTFDKLNFQKWIAVQFKNKSLLPPNKSIVDRYFDGLNKLNLVNDGKGLEFYLNPLTLVSDLPSHYFVLTPFTAHYTKSIPINKISQIIHLFEQLKINLIILGGEKDKISFESNCQYIINKIGYYSLAESSYVIKNALGSITADTGMMHIATAFKKPIYSVWGNTIPEFGFAPYFGNNFHALMDISKIKTVTGLSCIPCSKIGFDKCPKKHFNCMNHQNFDDLSSWTKQVLAFSSGT